MRILGREEILQLHAAAVAAHLATKREVLLAGLPPAFVQSLPTVSGASAQLLMDLELLNEIERLTDDILPLEIWLENAIAIAGPRTQSTVFCDALTCIKHKTRASQQLTVQQELEAPEPNHEDRAAEKCVSLLIKTQLPGLLASCEIEPKPLLIRAGAPTEILAGQTRLDQWSYVCEWLSKAGTRGIVLTLRIVDQVQAESFSERISRWASNFIRAMLQIIKQGGAEANPTRSRNPSDNL